ncbi:MAG: hypothetical protein ACYTHK_13395 [Planctomycetota bacterium]
MLRAVLCSLLIVPAWLHAESPTREKRAVDLLQRAVAAQGKLPRKGLQDLRIEFQGTINDDREGEHVITRTYWFRSKDRSFRVQTKPIDKAGLTERGVIGGVRGQYWELIKNRRQKLRLTNKTHLENIKAIRRDRTDFERIMQMVVLSRADSNLARLHFATPAKVSLDEDEPHSKKEYVFPKKVRGTKYHVLDLQRTDEDPLRLFINEKDLTVRKVIHFDRENPKKIRFVYYLGGYRKNGKMLLPNYVAAYTAVPTKKTREDVRKLSGRLTIALNAGLDNSIFEP